MKIRKMRVYGEYYDMIQKNQKTLEVRVAYSSMKKIQVGTIIEWCDNPDCRREVIRIGQYKSFTEMFENEDHTKMDPTRTVQDQMKVLKKIFPPYKEKIGILVFEMKPVR